MKKIVNSLNFFVTFCKFALYYIVGLFNHKTEKCRNTHNQKFFSIFEKFFCHFFWKCTILYCRGFLTIKQKSVELPTFKNFLVFLKNFFVTFFENALYYIVGFFNLKTKKCRNTHIWKFFNVFAKVFVILGWICTILYCRVF